MVQRHVQSVCIYFNHHLSFCEFDHMTHDVQFVRLTADEVGPGFYQYLHSGEFSMVQFLVTGSSAAGFGIAYDVFVERLRRCA